MSYTDLANKDLEDANLNLNSQLTEMKLRLGESQIKERELNLKNEFLKEENEKLHKQIELLHQKLKDQSELNAIKTTRLEEKLNFQQSVEAHSKMNESHDISTLSFNVPTNLGYGRSQSPRIGSVDKVKQLKKEHKYALTELKNQLEEKDEIIKDLVVEKEEYLVRINELENEVDYLNNQIDIARKEKEYLHQINILDNEKRNAEQKLAQLATP
jgi:chromosome segregation ATPase